MRSSPGTWVSSRLQVLARVPSYRYLVSDALSSSSSKPSKSMQMWAIQASLVAHAYHWRRRT